ncbi:hypothetical protein [Paraburkholderia saeva]|uniref:Uncharacterized protein n=1 Tax=Paraburkholderia saeva TaxID=2777537 RepID=A0A9N8X2U1_9BURK|nr:hypothetical protein [Paraburkholderia saeva]CAG4905735.1 hypothetical protein LMG31841_03481 [Paraburkholderia saeva]
MCICHTSEYCACHRTEAEWREENARIAADSATDREVLDLLTGRITTASDRAMAFAALLAGENVPDLMTCGPRVFWWDRDGMQYEASIDARAALKLAA